MDSLVLKEQLNCEIALSTLAIVAFVLFVRHCVMDNATSSDSITSK